MSGRQYLKNLRKTKDSPCGLGRRADAAETGFVGSLPLTTSEEIKEEEPLQASEVLAAETSEAEAREKQQEGISEKAKSPTSAPLAKAQEPPSAETKAQESKAQPEEGNKPVAANTTAAAVPEPVAVQSHPPDPAKAQSAAISPVQAAIPVQSPASEEPVKPSAPIQPIQPSESSVSGAVAAPYKPQEAASLPKAKMSPSKPLFEEPSSQTKHDLPRKEAEAKPAEKVAESGGALVVVAGIVSVTALGLLWLLKRNRK